MIKEFVVRIDMPKGYDNSLLRLSLVGMMTKVINVWELPKKTKLKKILHKVYGTYPDNGGVAPTKEEHEEAVRLINAYQIMNKIYPQIEDRDYSK